MRLSCHCDSGGTGGNLFSSALRLGLGASSEALAFTSKSPMHVYLCPTPNRGLMNCT